MGKVNNEFGASNASESSKNETENIKKYFQFGIFFDGTGNDMNTNHSKNYENFELVPTSCNASVQIAKWAKYKEWNSDGVILSENYSNKDSDDANDYSNVALLYKSYSLDESVHPKKSDYEVHIFKNYIEGPGTTGWIDSGILGGAFGWGSGGVLNLLKKAAKDVKTKLVGFTNIENSEFHFHVFGFSRGATLARMFCTMLLDENCPKTILSDEAKQLRSLIPRNSVKVDFLGVFDTVSSIGLKANNVDDYGLYLHDNVKNAMHLCASDEFRVHFALTDLGKAITRSNISEFFIPGCHTDVGGTYKSGTRVLKIEYQSKTSLLSEELFVTPHVLANNQFKISTTSPLNKNGAIENINLDTLEQLGWYSENKDKADQCSIVGDGYHILREIKQGYNLLPFNLMLDKAKKMTNMPLFKSVPRDISRFTIPEKVERLTEDVKKFIDKTDSGRHAVFPGGKYNSKKYRELRQIYINYSAAAKHVVNSPSFNGNVICRNVIHGDKGNLDVAFMSDYQL